MITKEVKLEISMVKIKGLLEPHICIHIMNIDTLYKRLQNNSKYPLKWLLSVKTSIDDEEISEKKRKELMDSLQDIRGSL